MRGVVLCVLLGIALAEKVRFDNFHMLVAGPVTQDHKLAIIESLLDSNEEEVLLVNDYLHKGPEVALLVAPNLVGTISAVLDIAHIPYTVAFTDFQAHIDAVDADNAERYERWAADQARGIMNAPETYLTNAQMTDWLTNLANNNAAVTFKTIGTTIEGRSINGVIIDGTTVSNPQNVYLGGGIHAREWISPATMAYIINEVATATSGDGLRMRQNYIWHVYPITNPDGYEYTHTTNRNWRKNRRNNPGSTCFGVDLNRNFGYLWGGPGASTSPCSDTYRGASAFSEPETQAIRDDVNSVGGSNIVLYMDVHSYSQFWLVPWGGTNQKPADYNQLKAGGDAAAVAIQAAEGRSFLVGTPPDILYVASGGALDWGKGGAGVKYSYSPELRPATAGQGGFVIPASNIYPSGREIFAGTVANIDYAAANP